MIRIFGQSSFELATHYIRRYHLHKMGLGVIEIDLYDVVAFVLIDQETERCRAMKAKETEASLPKGTSI
jgi:hypothetical protein